MGTTEIGGREQGAGGRGQLAKGSWQGGCKRINDKSKKIKVK
jgi:hypothetical protein